MFKQTRTLLLFCALTLLSYATNAQCTLSDVALTDVSSSGNILSFNMSFKHIRNSGNKWVTIHFWDQASYPNYNYDVDGVPTTLSLDSEVPIGTIVINNSAVSGTGTYSAAQAFVTSYQNDATFAICTSSSTILTYNSVTGIYTITGLTLVMPSGTSVLEADVWSSQANHNQQVHCYSKGIFPVVSGELPSLSGSTVCSTLTLTISAANPNSSAASGSHTVFADANNNNLLDGSDPVISGPTALSIAGNSTYTSGSISIPAANKYQDLYIILNVSGFSIAAVAKVEGCEMPLAVTGMETFNTSIQESKMKFTWTSQTEISNGFFQIEYSWNGIDWYTLASIASKYEDGNSVDPTAYSYTANIPVRNNTTLAVLGLGLLLFGGTLLWGNKALKLKTNHLLVAGVFLISTGLYSCKKQLDNNYEEQLKRSVIYTRLKQVDKDNTHYSYSQINTNKY